MPEYIVHKPVNLDKVKVARRRVLEEEGYLAANYDAEAKYDGCAAVMHFPAAGGVFTKSRTGEDVHALARAEHHLEPLLAGLVADYDGLVLMGEAWSPDIPQNEISGEFRRFAESPILELVVFDCLTYAEYEAGHTDVAKRVRRARLDPIMRHSTRAAPWRPATWWMAGTYGDPLRLRDELLADPAGYDGLVLTDPLGGWSKGSGTGGEQIKLKQTLSFDLRVIGVQEGLGKHLGRLGAVTVEFKGKELRVGTGFSDAEREEFWADPTKIIGKIIAVDAMDYSADGLLREPRYKGIRFDKLEPDA